MLPRSLARTSTRTRRHETSRTTSRLFDAFLNPTAYNNGGAARTARQRNGAQLTAAAAAGASACRGQVGNELDEFVTDSVRNTLVGLPLDLAAINIARGRSEGIPPLNNARTAALRRPRATRR